MRMTPTDIAGHPWADRAQRAIFVIITLGVCLALLLVFIQVSGVNHNESARFADMLNGTAAKPYVNRALVPWLDQALVALLPGGVQQGLRQVLQSSPQVQSLVAQFQAPPQLALEAMVCILILFACLAAFAFGLRYFLAGFYSLRPISLDLLCLAGLLCLIPFFGFGYIYDFSTLALFTWALAWMARRRWGWYLLAFTLAALNKETAILLLLVFVPVGWGDAGLGRRRFWLLAGMQAGIYLLTRLLFGILYAANPGGFVEIHLFESGMILQEFPLLVGIFLLGFGAICGLIFWRWKRKPRFLRWCALMLPPLVVLYALFGLALEIRVFYEAYPVVWGLAAGLFIRVQVFSPSGNT